VSKAIACEEGEVGEILKENKPGKNILALKQSRGA